MELRGALDPKPLISPMHFALIPQGMRVASGFRHGKYISESQTRNAYDFVGLSRLQEISEQGNMGQQYSADLLRPVHSTAATERTDGVIRLDKAKVRP
jgi:hypothetical protein